MAPPAQRVTEPSGSSRVTLSFVQHHLKSTQPCGRYGGLVAGDPDRFDQPPLGSPPDVALFLPFDCSKGRQRATKPDTRRNLKNRQILRGLTQGPATPSKGRQSAANLVFSAC